MERARVDIPTRRIARKDLARKVRRALRESAPVIVTGSSARSIQTLLEVARYDGLAVVDAEGVTLRHEELLRRVHGVDSRTEVTGSWAVEVWPVAGMPPGSQIIQERDGRGRTLIYGPAR